MKKINFFKRVVWLLIPLLTLFNISAWGATTVTYTFTDEYWRATAGGSSANWSSTANGFAFESSGSARGVQCTNNSNCTSPSSMVGVTSIVVTASSNNATGTIKVSIGSTEIATKSISNATDQTYTYGVSDYTGIAGLSGNIKLEITPGSKSVWVKSVAVTYITEKFTVTYNAGSGSCATASKKQDNIGDALTLPSASPNSDCADDGWIFVGWAKSSCTATGTKPKLYAASSAYLPMENETLYAVYRIGDIYTLDFESAASDYDDDWVYSNLVSARCVTGMTANSGSYYGSNVNGSGNAVTTLSIQKKAMLTAPKSISCYISKESGNTTSSTWYVEVSSDGSDWGEPVNSKSATGMAAGAWQEFTTDLSSYSNKYVRIRYNGSAAFRCIDDLEISCATYNSNPDCVYDYFVDIMHDNETIEKQGTYSAPAALSDATPGEDYCDEKHYHFLGWIEEQYLNENGTLKDASKLKAPGASITADNKTFYAIWAKEE